MAANVNPDLVKERGQATFGVKELSYVLYGGKEKFERKKEIENLVFQDEEFYRKHYHFLDRSELYSEGIRKTTHMVKRVRELGLHDPLELYWFRSSIYPNENSPTTLHTGMFIQTLLGQASEEQQGRWLQKALNFEIIGTYAQTEMGHGTFLRGLETTATYDERTQEFIIHSPTLTSIKWWPGGLGKTSNYAVVMADLKIKGQSKGMQAFMVQLRDMNTHQPLPGVTLGDIGPKFGYGMIDNGFLRLDQVRIPRTNMLMKNAQVLEDGTYIKSKHAKLGYGTMVFVRAMIVADVAAKGLSQAAVIAIRYSCVRHQSELKPGGPEPQVLDYVTQQYKLLPELAAAYAFTFAGTYISTLYGKTNKEILQGDMDKLPELHGLSSCLKALASYRAATGMEACRLACGGHGYSQASGLPKIYVNAVPACTYEGENTVMYLQTARYLMKMRSAAKTGQKLPATVAYIAERNSPCGLNKALSLNSLSEAFKHRARRLVHTAGDKLDQLTGSGMARHDAWNACSVNLAKAAEAHGEMFMVTNFVAEVQRIQNRQVAEALTQLCQLYAAHVLLQYSGDFLEDGYMSPQQVSMVREAELGLLAAIRPNAVALCDAFNFHDKILQSELGRYDGNVYENLYKWARDSPLNKDEVHDSFYKYMKPFQQASKL